MDDGDDPFASLIIPKCQTTSSQEEVFRCSRFAGEPEPVHDNPSSKSSSDASGDEEPATGIIMVSLPDSQNDLVTPHEDEDFQTPPEHSNSQHSSKDDQAPAAPKTPGDRITGGGGDCGGEAMEVDDWCADGQQGVDLGKDSDSLGFPTMKGNPEIDGGVGVSRVDCCSGDDRIEVAEVCDDESRKIGGLEGEVSVSRVCTEKLGTGTSNDAMMVDAEQTEIEKVGAGKLDSEFKDVCVGLTNRLITPNVSDKMPVRELEETGCVGVSVEKSVRKLEESGLISKSNKTGENGHGGLASKSIEEIEKFKYVGTRGRRELPFSLCAQENTVEGESSVAKKRILKDLLDGLKLVIGEVGDGAEGVDFLETAKRRGLTFPRPRWWQPKGFHI